jgi:glycosyltransferase involved in cell wall biosynthesis
MRVAFVHNHYRTDTPSGEDTAVELETRLLRDAGCEVSRYSRASDEIAEFSRAQKAALALRAIWSREDQARLSAFLDESQPDIAHVHNTFPLISPAAIATVAARGIPVVATLHNFRTFCVNAQLFRDGKPCEACVGRSPLPGLAHRCYRKSLPMSATIAAGIALHRRLGTWSRQVTRFIALSRFARQRFVASGLPADRLDVIPNFVERPDAAERREHGDYFLYLGRINFEKGLDFLASAWSPDMGKLMVVGNGPTRAAVEPELRRRGNVTFLDTQPHERAMEILAGARALIMPSRVYEGSPVALAEAYARGVPVIGPRHGAFGEYIVDGVTGRLFESGDSGDLARCIRQMNSADETRGMIEGSRAAYEELFTAERHLDGLLKVYGEASKPDGEGLPAIAPVEVALRT